MSHLSQNFQYKYVHFLHLQDNFWPSQKNLLEVEGLTQMLLWKLKQNWTYQTGVTLLEFSTPYLDFYRMVTVHWYVDKKFYLFQDIILTSL